MTGQMLDDDFLSVFFDTYNTDKIHDIVDSMSDISVLVIGEAVVDEYVYGEVIGKTNKSPSLVFSPHSGEVFAGVPMNVANHLSSFCKNVDAYLMVGRDGKERTIKEHLKQVNPRFFYWDSDTIVKRRYIASYSNSKVFEVYDFIPSRFDDTLLIDVLASTIDKYDLVLVCDSGHGMLTYNTRKLLQNKSKFIAINTQMNAGNVGTHSIRKYNDRRDNIFICVNEREFVLAYHEYWDRYSSIERMLGSINSGIIAVTTGPSGCKVSNNGIICSVPAFAKVSVDPVGAGDAFLSLASLVAYRGLPAEVIGFFGNVAGAIKMLYQGNKESITKNAVYDYIKNLREGA